jgi:hypothetical protein
LARKETLNENQSQNKKKMPEKKNWPKKNWLKRKLAGKNWPKYWPAALASLRCMQKE